jgi:hypothetical protein
MHMTQKRIPRAPTKVNNLTSNRTCLVYLTLPFVLGLMVFTPTLPVGTARYYVMNRKGVSTYRLLRDVCSAHIPDRAG